MSGQGRHQRPVDGETYRREHDRIFGRRLPDGWSDVHWLGQEQVHVKLFVDGDDLYIRAKQMEHLGEKYPR